MKLFAIILILSLSSCAVSKNAASYQEQATLICYIKEANNKAILKLHTMSGKEVIYYDKVRGLGKGEWVEGDKYTVNFDRNGNLTSITHNQ